MAILQKIFSSRGQSCAYDVKKRTPRSPQGRKGRSRALLWIVLFRRLYDEQLPERPDEPLVLAPGPYGDPDVAAVEAGKGRAIPDQDAAVSQPLDDLVRVDGDKFDEEEVRGARKGLDAGQKSELFEQPAAFLLDEAARLFAVPPVRERGDRGPLRRYAHGPGFLSLPQGGDRRLVGHRVPDAESRQAEKRRERPEADDAGSL